eukprot:TRINITY_DN2756_c0_g1_i2.p2 TRINITY_DN2756_c0_g1~~TRINITY_DN2756_c0_g1_i2.p2  ORF type:complete len:108 (-),score=34.34 TRINITY_DN2756_c0_g1_i2:196-519(-)
MCIRDRYQRRVHGTHLSSQKKNHYIVEYNLARDNIIQSKNKKQNEDNSNSSMITPIKPLPYSKKKQSSQKSGISGKRKAINNMLNNQISQIEDINSDLQKNFIDNEL